MSETIKKALKEAHENYAQGFITRDEYLKVQRISNNMRDFRK